MKTLSFLLFLSAVLHSFAADFIVLTDTNQLKDLPPHIKWERVTNLVAIQIVTQVTTNWVIVGPPQEIKNPNGVPIARRVYQSANYLTNVYRLYDNGERDLISSTPGPLLENRHYDIPPLLTDSSVVTPARIPTKQR